MRAVVYRYGCFHRDDLDELAMEQLHLAHELRNTFIRIWRQHEEAIREAWREHPEVDELASAIEVAEEEHEAAVKAWKKSKVRERNRKGDPDLKAAYDASRIELRELRTRLKEKKKSAYEELSPRFQELNEKKKAAEKETYATYSQERGLYWATYNLVRAQYMRAAQAVTRARRNGQMSELRFRRWTGEGQITVQLQRDSTAPPRTPELLCSERNPWRNVVQIPDLPAEIGNRAEMQPLLIRIGTNESGGPLWAEVPRVLWHRPIPPEADVAEVRVARRKIAGSHRLFIEMTVKLPDPEPSKEKGITGIDTGWRVLSDGSIRVAVWRSKYHRDPAPLPASIAEAVSFDGEGGEVRIPRSWIANWERCDDLRSERDKLKEILRADLIDAWPQVRDLPEVEGIDVSDIKQWKSFGRFRYLAETLQNVDVPISHRLREWRRQDRRLWEHETHKRRKFVDRRTDLYRHLAKCLTETAGEIAVEEPFAAAVTRRENSQADAIRNAAARAAPDALISAIKSAAAARGVNVTTWPGTDTTLTHLACGHRNQSGAGAKAVMIICEGCGSQFDQDANAAWNLVERAQAEMS